MHVKLQKKIPQVYPVQLNNGAELQHGTITSLLQTIKPPQTWLSISHPYRKYGHNCDPLELQRKLPDSIVHLGTKISEQLGTLLYAKVVFYHFSVTQRKCGRREGGWGDVGGRVNPS